MYSLGGHCSAYHSLQKIEHIFRDTGVNAKEMRKLKGLANRKRDQRDRGLLIFFIRF